MAYSPGYSNLLNTAYPQFAQYEIATGKKPRKSFAQGLLGADLYGAKKLGMEYNLRERMLAADEAYRAAVIKNQQDQLAYQREALAAQTATAARQQQLQQEQFQKAKQYARVGAYTDLAGQALQLPGAYLAGKKTLESAGLLGSPAQPQAQVPAGYTSTPPGALTSYYPQTASYAGGPSTAVTPAMQPNLLGTQTAPSLTAGGLTGTEWGTGIGTTAPTAGAQVGAAGTDVGAQTAALTSPVAGGSYTAAAPAYGAFSDAGATVGIGGGIPSGGAMAGTEAGVTGATPGLGTIVPILGALAIGYQLFNAGQLHRVVGDLAQKFGTGVSRTWQHVRDWF